MNSGTEYENASFLKQGSLKLDTIIQAIFNHCSTYIPPENIRKSRFSDVFRGYRNGTLVENGLTFLKNIFFVNFSVIKEKS